MRSLQDELNDSFQSDITIALDSNERRDLPTLHDSLAMELDNNERKPGCMSDSTRGKEIRCRSRGLRASSLDEVKPPSRRTTRGIASGAFFNYSGDEWGDPADDSDPDGRFTTLDEAIDNLVECVNLNFDSAYESQEEDAVDSDTTQRFVNGLEALPSQQHVEMLTSNLVSLHRSIVHSLQLHLTAFKELAQTNILEDAQDLLDENITSIMLALPQVDASLWNELILLEAENNALIADLSLLSDSLQITRQMTMQAQRSLKSAKENVDQWKSDLATVQYAQSWLADQEDKLSSRSTTRELQTIRSGFEEVCAQHRLQIGATT